jgi:uracil-DNA glycosylase
MAKNQVFLTAAPFIPKERSLPNLQHASLSCKGCDLYLRATQTIFGEGTNKAKVMLIGEQPGDKEDLDGRPFVGPAGRILDEALSAAGIARSEVYVTNAVKHFSWTPDERGKRRIHKKPRYSEIQACKPWLDGEIEAVRPEVIICMGATAAQSLLGKNFSVLRQRGTFVASDLAPFVIATVHPSSILRAREDRHEQMQAFIRDLTVAAKQIHRLRRAA